MTDKQATIFGTKVPTVHLPDDIVECADGSECRYGDALADCRGELHSSEEARHDADVAIVTEVLDGYAEWAEEYCTGNSDYPDCYAYVVQERRHDWDGRVKEWIEGEYGDIAGYTPFEGYIDEVVAKVCDELDAGFDCEPEYTRDSYGAYSGSGCCLDSFDIGEHEDQVDINGCDELKALHDDGRLDDILDDYNGETYVSRSRRRVKNEETGYYECVGRETYMPYEHDAKHPCFCIYTNISGQWYWVVDAERMAELVCAAILECNGYADED